MRIVLWLLVMLFFCFAPCSAYAQWVSISDGLTDLAIEHVATDPGDAEVVYAAGRQKLFKSIDAGTTWKSILSLRGATDAIHFIYVDPAEPADVYVGTEKGLKYSDASGKGWKPIFQESTPILCMARDKEDASLLWIGTKEGLFTWNKQNGEYKKIIEVPQAEIYSIFVGAGSKPAQKVRAGLEPAPTGNLPLLVFTQQGIYRKSADSKTWQRVFTGPEAEREEEETSLEQFEIEELPVERSFFSSAIYFPAQNKIYVTGAQGLLQADHEGSGWEIFASPNLPTRKINDLAIGAYTFYIATDDGVFEWDEKRSLFREIYTGLSSKNIHSLSYNARGDYLVAGTDSGVFKWKHPEANHVFEKEENIHIEVDDVLKHLSDEPSIQEIQQAAIVYAEVHPDKIQSWRDAAGKKALLPKASLGLGVNKDRNVEMDRGGTDDPDKFVVGPDKKSFDWSVGLNWDLGEIIWNQDQTSIDTRSRLMVQLRDDVLSEVTNLYYERKRLKLQLLLSPPGDIATQAEKLIRLEELEARIDALTGGYMTGWRKQHSSVISKEVVAATD